MATALAGGGLPTCEADLATCEADLAVALACGNGVVDAGEACDQAALNGASCGGLGFAGGTLRCASNCQLDADGCWSARFVDNADGTISDRQSGLMWEKKVGLDYTVNFADPHDADNMYFWAGRCSANIDKYCQPTAASAALCAAVATAGTEGCTLCDAGEGVCDQSGTVWDALVQLNAAGFAGHADWRLPSREELASMIDYSGAAYPSVDPAFHGTGCGATCAELADPACSCTRTFYYWSASSPLSVPPFAWLVDGGDGTQSQAVKIFDLHTRAVRGGF